MYLYASTNTHCVLYSMCYSWKHSSALDCSAVTVWFHGVRRVFFSLLSLHLSFLFLLFFLCLLSHWGFVKTQSLSCLHLNWGQTLTCTYTRIYIDTRTKTWTCFNCQSHVGVDVPTEDVALLRRDFPQELQPPQPLSISLCDPWAHIKINTNTNTFSKNNLLKNTFHH